MKIIAVLIDISPSIIAMLVVTFPGKQVAYTWCKWILTFSKKTSLGCEAGTIHYDRGQKWARQQLLFATEAYVYLVVDGTLSLVSWHNQLQSARKHSDCKAFSVCQEIHNILPYVSLASLHFICLLVKLYYCISSFMLLSERKIKTNSANLGLVGKSITENAGD